MEAGTIQALKDDTELIEFLYYLHSTEKEDSYFSYYIAVSEPVAEVQYLSDSSKLLKFLMGADHKGLDEIFFIETLNFVDESGYCISSAAFHLAIEHKVLRFKFEEVEQSIPDWEKWVTRYMCWLYTTPSKYEELFKDIAVQEDYMLSLVPPKYGF